MAKATGVGGVFLRARDPEALYRWYEEHLGIPRSPDGSFMFMGEEAQGVTVFALFPADTDYFGPGKQAAMMNFRVDDLDGVLEGLRSAGVAVEAPARLQLRTFWLVRRSGGEPGGVMGVQRLSFH